MLLGKIKSFDPNKFDSNFGHQSLCCWFDLPKSDLIESIQLFFHDRPAKMRQVVSVTPYNEEYSFKPSYECIDMKAEGYILYGDLLGKTLKRKLAKAGMVHVECEYVLKE